MEHCAAGGRTIASGANAGVGHNLQQTGLGIRGKEEFLHGWPIVFNASTGINPQSGQLANASATMTGNNGLPRSSYSEAIDGARAGQPLQ